MLAHVFVSIVKPVQLTSVLKKDKLLTDLDVTDIDSHSPSRMESRGVQEWPSVLPCYTAGAARACVACGLYSCWSRTAASDAEGSLSSYDNSPPPSSQSVDRCCCQWPTRHTSSASRNIDTSFDAEHHIIHTYIHI